MKLIKLIGLAAVLCLLIFGAKKGLQALQKMNQKEAYTSEIVGKYPEIAYFTESYLQAWQNASRWSPELHKVHIDSANSLRTAMVIDFSAHSDIINDINNAASMRVISLLENDYKKSKVPEDEVKFNLSGINVLLPKLGNKADAQKMVDAWAAYGQMKALATKSYSASQFKNGFNGSSWTPFNTHKQAEVTKRDNWLKNPYYKEYFNNCTVIKDGLNSLPSRVEKCRNDYYNTLANTIVNRYGKVPTFDPTPWQECYRDALDNEQRKQVTDDYNKAWSDFSSSYSARSRSIKSIAGRFKDEAPADIAKKVSDVSAKYVVISSQPSLN